MLGRTGTLPLAVLACLACLLTAATAQQVSDTIAPEGATGVSARELARAERYMVAAANPLAVEAALDTLRDGGTAADALVAAQAVLGLVEPQSSGLGGGAFLLWYDAESGTLTSIDARETAPASAGGDLFLDADGAPLPFMEAVIGGRSVGVPGVPLLLETVHQRWGRLDWAGLFTPAIRFAEDGFAVSPRLHAMIAADAARLATQEATRNHFLANGASAPAAGTILTSPDYARTLETLAAEGAEPFYRGAIAARIVEAVRGHPTNPGDLTPDDLAAYRLVEREPVCGSYRDHSVCGMGPPSSGGIAVGQILGMIEAHDLAGLGPEDPHAWRLLGDATRLAFADRERYLADPDFVSVPPGLLDPDYLAGRGGLLRRDGALTPDLVIAGDPPRDRTELRLDGFTWERPATTHLVIVDGDGNVASLTSTIEGAFGSRLMVDGFLLNNQLTDFSFRPDRDGVAIANRVEGGKRPRSSMAPTIVLRDGRPLYALGSPGGANIIPYVAKTLVGLIDWNLDMQQAIDLPHLVNRFGTYDLEAGTPAEDLAYDLQALGYETSVRELNSGLHGIALTETGLEGGADSRREGVAAGD